MTRMEARIQAAQLDMSSRDKRLDELASAVAELSKSQQLANETANKLVSELSNALWGE